MATTLAVVIKPGGVARGPLFSSVAHGVQSEKGSLGGCWSGLAAEGTSSDRRPQARSDGERSRRCCGFVGEVSRHRSSGFQARHPCRLIDVGSRRLCGHYDIRIRKPALPDIINCSTTHHSPSNPGKSIVSAFWGVWLGVATSILSAAAFNFLHLPPAGRFTIADSRNWVALGTFFVAAVATSSVSELARRRAEEAKRRRTEADLTAEMAQLLLARAGVADALVLIGRRLAAALKLPWATITLGGGHRESPSGGDPAAGRRPQARHGGDSCRPARGACR